VNANAAPPMVLVADDEPTMLELVTRHLRSIEPKLEVIEASDGDEAWRLARERLPDLVVLDVMMPGMSGWEVCRKIRQDAALAHTGVVMLTGIGESLNEATSPLFGADEYIDKPFDFEKLDEKILEVLERRAPQREAVPRPVAGKRSASTQVGNGVGGPAKPAPAKVAKASRVRKAKPVKRTVKKQAKPVKRPVKKPKASAKAEKKGKKTMAAKKAKKAAKKAKKTAKKAKKK
jgi:DNA-binding response OmpR family regulator